MSENRRTFFARLDGRFAPAEVAAIDLAYFIAKNAHRTQVRRELGPDGQPLRYFEHVRRTALILLDEAQVADADLISAALLHDAWEDAPEPDPQITPAFIRHALGPDVERLVVLLSKKPKEGYLERLLEAADWRPLAVKAADRLDNLRSLQGPTVPQAFRVRQQSETREKYWPIFDRMLAITPEERAPGVPAMVAEIRRLSDDDAA